MKTKERFQLATAQGQRLPLRQLRGDIHARLMAQEYIRNGMSLADAYATVTGALPATAKSMTNNKLLKGNVDAFMDEISVQLRNADIDKDKVLAQLWTVIQSSILDFFDENGQLLSISEMKKLPRFMQNLIHTLDVTTKQQPVKDGAGNVMIDDNGRPYLRNEQVVKIQIPSKLDAIKQLALLMKWVGPDLVINNNVTVNVGVVMAGADDRRRRMETLYEQAPAVTLRADSDPAAT